MNKICGYSCEHNKSGVCQISVCDKKSIISDKTEVQTFTKYIYPTITELQQENKQLKDNWNKLRELILEEGFEINTREYGSLDVIDKNVILEKMQELERSDNNE